MRRASLGPGVGGPAPAVNSPGPTDAESWNPGCRCVDRGWQSGKRLHRLSASWNSALKVGCVGEGVVRPLAEEATHVTGSP
jgi:hypothetical protein